MNPKMLVVNDLAGVGKVALSIAFPVLSALNIEVSPLPTVYLSAHTAFPNSYRQALTNAMCESLAHFQILGVSFDSILAGYFADEQQIDKFLEHLPETKQLIVDPIMADNGKLYSCFSTDYSNKLRELAKKADLLMPNLTEACLLADFPYPQDYSKEEIEILLYQLSQKLGVTKIIITGLYFSKEQVSVALLDNNTVSFYYTDAVPQQFIGTGDLFSALISACYTHKIPFEKSIPFILKFIADCLKDTLASGRDFKMGILFEQQLHQLTSLSLGG